MNSFSSCYSAFVLCRCCLIRVLIKNICNLFVKINIFKILRLFGACCSDDISNREGSESVNRNSSQTG